MTTARTNLRIRQYVRGELATTNKELIKQLWKTWLEVACQNPCPVCGNEKMSHDDCPVELVEQLALEPPPVKEVDRAAFDEIYYNTVKYSGQDLAIRLHRAKNQDQAVLLFMTNHPNKGFTRDEIYNEVMPGAKDVSAGRSLNTLMEAGYVDKFNKFRMGDAGSKQHLWKLKPQPNREPEQGSMFDG